MKITVIGLGYLGATHAVAMAKVGHQVIGIEPNQQKIDSLGQGKAGFFEPGLDEALAEQIALGRIVFKSKHDESSRDADIHFICVGTPQKAGSLAADTSYLESAIRDLAPYLREDALVVVSQQFLLELQLSSQNYLLREQDSVRQTLLGILSSSEKEPHLRIHSDQIVWLSVLPMQGLRNCLEQYLLR